MWKLKGDDKYIPLFYLSYIQLGKTEKVYWPYYTLFVDWQAHQECLATHTHFQSKFTHYKRKMWKYVSKQKGKDEMQIMEN